MGVIGEAIGAASGIFGGASASSAMRKARRMVKDQIRKNQDWYDRRYHEDATQRADAQRIIALTEENIRKRNKAAAGRQAVMGGTEESVAAAKDANRQALADATAQIAVDGAHRKDQIEQQYMERDSELKDRLAQIEAGRAEAIADAVKNGAQGLSGLAELV